MQRASLVLHDCRFVVLDEADEMLDLGFLEDVEKILSATPNSRQTALFSATMPPPIRKLADRYLYDPVHVKVKSANLTVDTVEQFRGLDAVSHKVAWVGGSNGSVFRTVDGGDTWANVSPPGSTGLLFRDVEAFGRNRAVVLAIGEGDASRIYRTDDGGQTWTQTFTNPDAAAFYDCMAFADARHGLALSDPPDGKFRIIATRDGGRSWQVRSNAGMPAALDGEFAFAASGTCVATVGKKWAWIATGGGERARILATTDQAVHQVLEAGKIGPRGVAGPPAPLHQPPEGLREVALEIAEEREWCFRAPFLAHEQHRDHRRQ
jgi:photosystem II stability/assembly factor-like uncharacterized protein